MTLSSRNGPCEWGQQMLWYRTCGQLMSCINGPTAPGRPEGPGRAAVAVLCLRRGSHARAHLAAGSHDVIPSSLHHFAVCTEYINTHQGRCTLQGRGRTHRLLFLVSANTDLVPFGAISNVLLHRNVSPPNIVGRIMTSPKDHVTLSPIG